MPVEPPPTPWELPAPETADDRGVVGIGADLEPGTLLAAYRSGLFPMPVDGGVVAWWSPDPRGILPLARLKVTRSLRQSAGRFQVSVDRAFPTVIEACADPDRPHGWISRPVIEAYVRLHELGWAHSVEVWDGDDLVGGLYGVAVGGLFAGESMFHRARDASKVALLHLVRLLDDARPRLLDVQWTTPHLVSLGAVDVPRPTYLALLGEALEAPLPEAFRT
ncbi:MAG TPA: leucyl/phenylalanyl-tRNA--protein transferase [Acidimicrobiales bacterium]|nr:leucyl/phenylalanyl-tRNA--protein transferase [Acidimicrobiales bacterium]